MVIPTFKTFKFLDKKNNQLIPSSKLLAKFYLLFKRFLFQIFLKESYNSDKRLHLLMNLSFFFKNHQNQ